MTIAQAFQMALQHHQAGRLAEAEALYRQILGAQPNHADTLHLLGVIAHQAAQDDAAVGLIQKAVAISPGVAAYHSNLGEVYRKLGRVDDAIASFQRALELNPAYAKAHNNLGAALAAHGQREEAITAYRCAVELQPDYAQAFCNLGGALAELGRFDESAEASRRALELAPGSTEARLNLGMALVGRGDTEEAVALYQDMLRLLPDSPQMYSNLGGALKTMGRTQEAMEACRKALRLDPDFADAYSNLGSVLMDAGLIPEAIAEFREAVRRRPDSAGMHTTLILLMHYALGFDEREIFAEHRRWDAVHARPLAEFITPHGNDRDPDRRLKIGYVSANFCGHAVAYFIEDLLANHDRSKVEIFCYADLEREDAFTGRCRQFADHWRAIRWMSDAQVADRIRRDEIDILVDLAGHTLDNRLLVFARKPAPVQVTYLGYPDTTGLATMDFRFTDVHADPPGTTEHLHSEELVRLPDTAWCYRPADGAPPVGGLPAAETGRITFGCFNVMAKVTDEMVALWGRVLAQVPGSRLLLKNHGLGDRAVLDRVLQFLEKAGVAKDRVDLFGKTPTVAEHLGMYGRVDIALDTFPYHGTTTTCDALWMGVPVVTLAGRTHVSRVSASLLENVGLPGLIASSEEEYISIAAKLAADTARLSDLRATLRGRMSGGVLTDGVRFAGNVEEAYRKMWRAWCAGGPTKMSA